MFFLYSSYAYILQLPTIWATLPFSNLHNLLWEYICCLFILVYTLLVMNAWSYVAINKISASLFSLPFCNQSHVLVLQSFATVFENLCFKTSWQSANSDAFLSFRFLISFGYLVSLFLTVTLATLNKFPHCYLHRRLYPL